MRRGDQLVLLLLLALMARKSSSSAPRSNSGIPEGPPTEDNWIPSQPTIPPNPLDPHK